MKKIHKFLKKNQYIRETKHAVFDTLLDNVFLQNKTNAEFLKQTSYVHVLIQYPAYWPANLDLFNYISEPVIADLQRKKCFFVFDASAEGFDPIEENWFELIYYSCRLHDIDPRQIIFVSSNLKDYENIQQYCTENYQPMIHTVASPMFETGVRTDQSGEILLQHALDTTKEMFSDRYFSSLSRVNRHYRKIGTFLLCQSTISKHGLISHNSIEKDPQFEQVIESATPYSKKHFKRWAKSLPLTVDQTNFKHNWAINTPYDHIHHQTLFQIVNETLVDDCNNRSLFYSEKTFRPISCFQPFVIYGQQGCNRYLETLGYRTYNDWFDLSFDCEPDNIKRYQMLLASVEDACKLIDSLTPDQKIEWKFKNRDVLLHNFEVLQKQQYTEEKLKKLISDLVDQMSEHLK